VTEQSASKSETVVERIADVSVGVGKVLANGIETVGREVEKSAVEGGTAVVDATKIIVGDIAATGRQLDRDVRVVVSRASDSLTPSTVPVPAVPAPVTVPVTPVVVAPVA
jgi:hypothetical protein